MTAPVDPDAVRADDLAVEALRRGDNPTDDPLLRALARWRDNVQAGTR